MPRKRSRERDDVAVVDAALHDGVHLHRDAGRRGRVDSLEHARDGEVDVVQRCEGRVVERVEADGDAVEAGARERLGLLREQRAVRRQRDLQIRNRREQLDEVFDVAPDERLAAGDPDRPHAERGEDADDALDLLEAQELLAVEEGVVAAEDLLRHAVDAAEVATVGDRDPQRLERPSERVEDRLHQRSVAVSSPLTRTATSGARHRDVASGDSPPPESAWLQRIAAHRLMRITARRATSGARHRDVALRDGVAGWS